MRVKDQASGQDGSIYYMAKGKPKLGEIKWAIVSMPDRPTLPALLTNQNTGFRIFALAKSQPFIRFELRHPGERKEMK